MRKFKISVAAILIAGTSLAFTSCIGSFALTNKVLGWNRQIGPKFVNELVFFAFWVLPVYEITALADVLVINSIEFWSGDNPLTASVKSVDTEHGRYLIACDGKGYTVTHEATGEEVRLDFATDTQTWSVITKNGESLPLMTFLDDTHVRMATPDGSGMEVELSEYGVMAYEFAVGANCMAMR
ncbi:MAG: DUF3332 domain-containing protein [Muribaculaceae bacterium]|nr:DUF3332 domain-containing protein [Muribaculaceae bacterium]